MLRLVCRFTNEVCDFVYYEDDEGQWYRRFLTLHILHHEIKLLDIPYTSLSKDFQPSICLLPKPLHPLCLGIDYLGEPVVEDLVDMPHLLIAGSTGSGKSTLLNSLLAAIVYSVNDQNVNLVISDTKGVEFNRFAKVPHMLFEPATSAFETSERMEWLCEEADRRLKIFAQAGVRNIHEFNTMTYPGHGLYDYDRRPLSFIVFVIDEVADLIGKSANQAKHKELKTSIAKLCEQQLSRIAARSRAAGIYVIAATQRPSVDVINGVIKANFPGRLSFRLPSQVDSRTVLGTGGAEHLLAQGDCLFLNPNRPGLQRIHAPLTPIEDVEACVEYAKIKATA